MTYRLIQRTEPSRDLDGDYCDKRHPEDTTMRLVKLLEQMGYSDS